MKSHRVDRWVKIFLGFFCFWALTLPACAKTYKSPQGDFECEIPSDWQVKEDSFKDNGYENITFNDPNHPECVFVVRWYKRNEPHPMGNNHIEMFGGPTDYSDQILHYYNNLVEEPLHNIQLKQLALQYQETLKFVTKAGTLRKEDYPAYLHFTGPSMPMFTSLDQTDQMIAEGSHSYVLIGMKGGFYVLISPAPANPEPKYADYFTQVLKSFVVLKYGPGGEAVPQKYNHKGKTDEKKAEKSKKDQEKKKVIDQYFPSN